MSFCKVKLLGDAPPESEQAKILYNKIVKHTCIVTTRGNPTWGMLMPERHILCVAFGGSSTVSYDGKRKFETFTAFSWELLCIKEAVVAPNVSMPPVSYSKPYDFLFGAMGGNLVVFERQKGAMGLKVKGSTANDIWAGLPLFTHCGMLSAILLGESHKQFLCASPQPILNNYRKELKNGTGD